MTENLWGDDANDRVIPAVPGLRQPVSTSHTPLHNPEDEAHAFVPTLQQAIDRARKVLDEKAQANIHDQDAMIRAAYGLHYVLHDLLAALDAERGEGR